MAAEKMKMLREHIKFVRYSHALSREYFEKFRLTIKGDLMANAVKILAVAIPAAIEIYKIIKGRK